MKIFFLASLLFCLSGLAHGQDPHKNVTPPSPNVSALGKYGDIPVSLYTGVPDISVPIYEIKNGDLALPISISYHAAGIKVEEMASSVGLGWTLNAGGVVGRSVMSRRDELSGWASTPVGDRIETLMNTGNPTLIANRVKDVENGAADGEPDLYYYNFDQYAGKFIYDQAGVAHTIPYKKIKISPEGVGWKIVGEDGTVYTFTKEETIQVVECTDEPTTSVAWYLTNIKSSDGKREINLFYDEIIYEIKSLQGESKYLDIVGNAHACTHTPGPGCPRNSRYISHRLTKIDFEEGYVKFNYNTIRCDLVADKSLDEIELYTKNNELLKRFLFNYSYFGNTSNGCSSDTETTKRLKLLSLREQHVSGPSGTYPVQPYEFFYNEEVPFPDRMSLAQDHWGYYNGKHGNTSLIARFFVNNSQGQPLYFPGADRNVDAVKAQAGILKSIKYPTGGETVFTFESNTVTDPQIEPEVVEKPLGLSVADYLVADLPVPFESTGIELPNGGFVEYTNITGFDHPLWQFCDIVQCQIIKDNDETNPFTLITTMTTGLIEFWPAGNYKIKIVTDCGAGAVANFNVSITARSIIDGTAPRPVGGLRIAQIEDKAGNGAPPVVRKYRYHLKDDPTRSSGVLTSLADYQQDIIVTKFDETGLFDPVTCVYRVIKSVSNYPMASANGRYVGYGHVIVDYGSNGESWYSYTAYPNPTRPPFPYAHLETLDWRRGFLESSKDFIRKGNQLIPVKEIINTPHNMNEHTIYGLKTGRDAIYIHKPITIEEPFPVYAFYPIKTEFFDIGKVTERIYDVNDPTKYIETVKDFTYGSTHLQLAQIKATTNTLGEKKEQIVTNRKYPLDYTFTGTPAGEEAEGIEELQNRHVVNAVVEEYQVRQEVASINPNIVSNARVVGGSITTFKPDAPYPHQIFRLEIQTPIELSAQNTFGNGSKLENNTFAKYSAYKPVATFVEYDDNGNLITQKKENDVEYRYLWDYDKSYPVAVIENSNSTAGFAYSSFETAVKGNWNYFGSTGTGNAKTGKSYYQLTTSYNISKSLSEGQYTLQYWAKSEINFSGATVTSVSTSQPDSYGWSLYVKNVNLTSAGLLTLSGNTDIDELRIFPAGAQMTTYTYEPIVGVKTQTDTNGKPLYYEYDEYERLWLTKDSEYNVLKRFEYHHQQR